MPSSSGSDELVADPSQSYPDYLDLRDRNRSFDGLAAFNIDSSWAWTRATIHPRAWVLEVTGNYFDVLRIQPYLGRFFHASDEHGPNSAPYIVLGYAYWHSHFHDDRGVVGRVVQLNKHPFTDPRRRPARFPRNVMFFSPDFFVPMVNQRADRRRRIDPQHARKSLGLYDGRAI